jgi:hypothetical protein
MTDSLATRLAGEPMVTDAAEPPLPGEADPRVAAIDQGINAIMTAMVSVGWAVRSLRRAEEQGAPARDLAAVVTLLDRAEQFLEAAETSLAAQREFARGTPRAADQGGEVVPERE